MFPAFKDAAAEVTPEYVNSYLQGNLNKIVLEGRQLLKPPPEIKVSQWAEKYRIVSDSSRIPGRYRNINAPHLVKMMDCVNDPQVRQISVMGSSQIGKTDGFINNILGYLIDVDPCHIILMLPSDNDARDYSNQKLEPFINDTAVVKAKVSKSRSRDKDNSTLRKRFIGGYLTIVSGATPRSTRMRSARVVIGDDIDGIDLNAKEGDPVDRLKKRTTTFKDDYLHIFVSTPTLQGSSRIAREYNESNQCKYYVRCPHCGTQQYLKHQNLDWFKEYDMFKKVVGHDFSSVRYMCEGCKVLLTEGERIKMLQAGDWIPDRPWIKDHWGFWINELSSTLSTMENVARQIAGAGDDTDKLESLYNTVLGLPYQRSSGQTTDPLKLMQRIEDFIDPNDMKIPEQVLFVTGTADVQQGVENDKEKPQRLEVEVWGWGKGKERWLLYKDVIPGNLKIREQTFDKLDEIWDKTFYRTDNVPLKIAVKFVDSGDETQTVYDYVRGREHENLFAIKGQNKYGASILPRKFSLVDKDQVKLLYIGTQIIKTEIFRCLNDITTPGPKYTHFPRCFCDAEYFTQLTAEHEVTKYVGTYSYKVFERKKKSEANEALDLYVYNYAAMEYKNPNFDAIERDIEEWKKQQNIEVQNQDVVEEDPEEIVARMAAQKRAKINPQRRNFVTGY